MPAFRPTKSVSSSKIRRERKIFPEIGNSRGVGDTSLTKLMTTIRPLAIFAALPLLSASAHAVTLFGDTFTRANNNNIDATMAGITDNTGSNLSPDAVYTYRTSTPTRALPPTARRMRTRPTAAARASSTTSGS